MQNQTRNLIIVALLALLVVVTCWKQSPGQAEGAKPVANKWEYMTLDLSRLGKDDSGDQVSRMLSELSIKEGYELASTYQSAKGSPVLVIRRPKAGK